MASSSQNLAETKHAGEAEQTVDRQDKHWFQSEYNYEGTSAPVFLKSGPIENRKC